MEKDGGAEKLVNVMSKEPCSSGVQRNGFASVEPEEFRLVSCSIRDQRHYISFLHRLDETGELPNVISTV